MMNATEEKFVGGYSEQEIEGARELARELNFAAKKLVGNEYFRKVFKHYTEDKVLDETMKATMAPEHRPEFFESVINSNAFKVYFEELLSYIDDVEK